MKQLKSIVFVILGMLCAPAWALDAPNPTKPEDNLTNAYTRQFISWDLVNGAGSYQVQMDTTLAFNSPWLEERTFTSNSSQCIYHLHFDTQYYWRMRAISKTNPEEKSEWCSVRTFHTLKRPSLKSINDSNVTGAYYPQQTLTWKNNYGCTKYTLEIDTVETFDSPAKRRWSTTNSATNKDEELSMSVSDCYLNCFNYWRVKAYNDNDSSEWSVTYRFHTLRRAKAKSPNDLNNAYTTQYLTWEYYRGLGKVIIELDTTPSFSSPELRTINSFGYNSEGCSTNVTELLFGTTYYWHVRSYHANDTTDWSQTLSFTTYNFCKLSTPGDSATNQLVSGKIWWKWSKGISKYQVQMDTVPTFDSPEFISVIESASSDDYAYYSYKELFFGKTYYWRVRECHSRDTSKWSVTRCFTTYQHCNLTATPTDGATNVSISPKLYFNYTSGINYYQMQLDTTPTFDSPLLQTHIEKATSNNNTYHSYSNLLYGTTYYRRVRECHSRDTSNWSPIRTFTTKYLMPQPTIVGPTNQTTVQEPENISFSWNPSEGAIKYILQVSINGQFTDIVYQTTTTDCEAVVDSLPTNIVLYWRICAVDAQGRSPWSPIWSLSISSSIGTGLFPAETLHDTGHKFIRDGHLYIRHQQKVYTPLGLPLY